MIENVKKDVLSIKDIDRLNEILKRTINLTTIFDSDIGEQHKYKKFWMLLEHAHHSNCSSLMCFCQKEEIIAPKNTPYWRSILLMETFYQSKMIKISKKKNLFVKYINFMIDIKGDILSAHLQINNDKRENLKVLSKIDKKLFSQKISYIIRSYSKERSFKKKELLFGVEEELNKNSKFNDYLIVCEDFAEFTKKSEKLFSEYLDKKEEFISHLKYYHPYLIIYRNCIELKSI